MRSLIISYSVLITVIILTSKCTSFLVNLTSNFHLSNLKHLLHLFILQNSKKRLV